MLIYRIDRARGMVVLTGSGPLSADEVLSFQDRLRADPEFDPTFRLLADYREATTTSVDTERLRKFAANAPFAADSLRAFVVARDADFGMLRMFETFTALAQRRQSVRVFRDLDAAMQWLEAPAP